MHIVIGRFDIFSKADILRDIKFVLSCGYGIFIDLYANLCVGKSIYWKAMFVTHIVLLYLICTSTNVNLKYFQVDISDMYKLYLYYKANNKVLYSF